ncbi:MAG: hypothetical protein ACI4ST_03585 [Candidatus Gallimonas sp.]
MTKKKAKNILISAALAAGMILPCATPAAVSVDAGSTKSYITNTSSVNNDSINTGDFFVNGKVYAKDSKMVFDEKCSAKASVVSKAQVKNLKEYGLTDMFTLKATFNLANLVAGGKVAVAFGLKNSGSLGEDESAEIAFTYDNGLWLEVNEYKNGSAQAFVAKQKNTLLSLNTDIKMTLKVECSGKIYLSFTCNQNEIKVLSGRPLNIDAQGSVGVFSVSSESGKNKFTVAEMETLAYVYETPLTVESYFETFDGGYNANMFYSESSASPLKPSKIAVEDGKLKFQNVATGYFTTKEVFSNFELTFDVTDFGRKAKYDQQGNLTQLVSSWFMIGFGVDNYNDPASENIQATFLQFDYIPMNTAEREIDHENPTESMLNKRYVLYNNGTAVHTSPMGDKNLWNEEYAAGKTVNVKLVVEDGVISLYHKLEDEAEYGDPQYSYDLGITQTGYVRFFTYGDTAIPSTGLKTIASFNMTIDNLRIRNLDHPNVMQVKAAPVYKSNLLHFTKDYDYTTVPDENDLLGNKLKKGIDE